MRLAELSRRSGISTPTIKYYLRLGVLPPGEVESTTWASYAEEHLQRLRLIRALTDVAGLSLEEVRRVLAAVDDTDRPLHDALGAAQWAISPPPAAAPTERSVDRVDALLRRHGWDVHADSPHRARLAAALDTLDALDHPTPDELLDAYADAMGRLAATEVARVPVDNRARAAERTVVGTLLHEPVLLTLRRMADEAASARR